MRFDLGRNGVQDVFAEEAFPETEFNNAFWLTSLQIRNTIPYSQAVGFPIRSTALAPFSNFSCSNSRFGGCSRLLIVVKLYKRFTTI